MANYRNSLQIYADVLEKTGEKGRQGIKVTELLTKSNLSHPRLVPLLKKFTQSGLINEIIYDGKNTYVLTEKCILYLQEYKKFDDFTRTFGLDL